MKIIDVQIKEIHVVSRMVRDGEFHSHPGKEHDAKQSILEISTEEVFMGR